MSALIGRFPEKKIVFFRALPKFPPPPLFSGNVQGPFPLGIVQCALYNVPPLDWSIFCFFFIENALCICASLYWSIFCIFIENTLCILSDYYSLVRAPPTAQAWLTSLHSLVTLMIRRAWLDLQKSLLFQNLLSSAKSPYTFLTILMYYTGCDEYFDILSNILTTSHTLS